MATSRSCFLDLLTTRQATLFALETLVPTDVTAGQPLLAFPRAHEEIVFSVSWVAQLGTTMATVQSHATDSCAASLGTVSEVFRYTGIEFIVGMNLAVKGESFSDTLLVF